MKNSHNSIFIALLLTLIANNFAYSWHPFVEESDYIHNLQSCSTNSFRELIPGYPFESHQVVTQDGYILNLFRIQAHGSSITSGKPVLYLQHGLMDSADDFVVNTPSKSLGTYLADRGYDVWLGNSRGNKYSQGHTGRISKKDYYAYSFQQMGRYDVPANIAHILQITGKPNLVYVGHSQGTTQMFAALSDRATSSYINSKVSKFIALAPVVYLNHLGIPGAHSIAQLSNTLLRTANLFGVYLMAPATCQSNSLSTKLMSFVCQHLVPQLCAQGVKIADPDQSQDNTGRYSTIFQHFPAGASVQCYVHFGQFAAEPQSSPVFRKFDYGSSSANRQHYGQSTPPAYNLGLINIPVRMFVGTKDPVGDPIDNQYLFRQLQGLGKNVKQTMVPNWGHMTFAWPSNPANAFNQVLSQIQH